MTREQQEAVFASWVRDHAGIVSKVARAFATTPADEPDLAQEIQVALWHGVPAFNGRAKVSTYVYRIALNRAISWGRRERIRPPTTGDVERLEVPAESGRTDPRLDLVYAEIRRLSAAERALILMQLDGFSYQEIGDALGLSPTNVGVRSLRIRRKLTASLKDKHP